MLNEVSRGRSLLSCMTFHSASRLHALMFSKHSNSQIQQRARRMSPIQRGLAKRGNVVSFVGLCLQWLPLMGAIPSPHPRSDTKATLGMAFSLIPNLEFPRSFGRHGLPKACRQQASPLLLRSLHHTGTASLQVNLLPMAQRAMLGHCTQFMQHQRTLTSRRAKERDMDSPWAFLDPEDVPELTDGDGNFHFVLFISLLDCVVLTKSLFTI
jgi:hypothetical protein